MITIKKKKFILITNQNELKWTYSSSDPHIFERKF